MCSSSASSVGWSANRIEFGICSHAQICCAVAATCFQVDFINHVEENTMAEMRRLQGGVIVSDEKRSYGVVELLAYRVRNRIELTYYIHPYEIDITRHQFIIVFSVEDLALVVKTYYIKSAPAPLIIHIDEPDVLNRMEYAARFPGIEIAPIEQANLADKESTLKFALFQDIIESLTFSGAHDAHQQHVDRQTGTADRSMGSAGDGSQSARRPAPPS
jgi:hypothetical protein